MIFPREKHSVSFHFSIWEHQQKDFPKDESEILYAFLFGCLYFLIPDPFFVYRGTSETFSICLQISVQNISDFQITLVFHEITLLWIFFSLKAPISLERAFLLAFTLFSRKISFPFSNFNSSFGSIKPSSLMNFSSSSPKDCLVQQSKVFLLVVLQSCKRKFLLQC